MAIILSTNYSKKLGLPGYSSHAFSASIEVELGSVEQAQQEIHRLYEELQRSVDEEIQVIGFVPNGDYGMNKAPNFKGRNVSPSQLPTAQARGNNGGPRSSGPGWKCSAKQKELIEKIIAERKFDKSIIEGLSLDRFHKGVMGLNKLEASGLIDLLFNQNPLSPPLRSLLQRPHDGSSSSAVINGSSTIY
jgi:hypothetical protein